MVAKVKRKKTVRRDDVIPDKTTKEYRKGHSGVAARAVRYILSLESGIVDDKCGDVTYLEAMILAQVKQALIGDTSAFNALMNRGWGMPKTVIEASVEHSFTVDAELLGRYGIEVPDYLLRGENEKSLELDHQEIVYKKRLEHTNEITEKRHNYRTNPDLEVAIEKDDGKEF